jgi:hypothetical protein
MTKALWLHGWYITADPKYRIDLILSRISGKGFTDLFVQAQDDDQYPVRLTGKSTLFRVTTARVGILTPTEYLIQQAHLIGIRVHAWWVIGVASEWNGLNTPFPSGSFIPTQGTDYGGWWLDLSKKSVRDRVTATVLDFMQQNAGLDGLHLDYIRYGVPVVRDPADVTAMVAELRATTNKILSAATTTKESSRQDVKAWAAVGLDWLVTMNYLSTIAERDTYIKTVDIHRKVLVGIICQGTTPANFRAYLQGFKSLGYRDFSIFAYSWMTDEYLSILVEETMPVVNDLTNAANVIEAQAGHITEEIAELTAQVAELTAQVAILRQSIADLGQADLLADQLADLI